jgi:hypothetical protein
MGDSENEMHEEEYETGIQLTKEFTNDNVQPCSIIELISLFKNDEKNGVKLFDDIPAVKLTKDYLDTFNRYGVSEKLASKAYNIRRIFAGPEDIFSNVEQTALVDLAPTKAEEAYSLIPTLRNKKNLTPETLQGLLDTLNKECQI